ncbi:hypothetical protein BRE01_63020 [Brevibacillus reuszeri]|uniref:Uncharacterized protein n=1 Tax=Brevibacillus reuszeri TaxID=54915 RepID=A0A0K9YWI0_9BACL|nr:hypothetical protein ADS79_14255 [Brevibacillus reuszeri]GED72600.1 hypothetical protein BRE01_63020 [Brevibacillus reuszeri]
MSFKSLEEGIVSNETHRFDPTVTLSKEGLEIFYDIVSKYDNVTTKEWNDLIKYIRFLSLNFEQSFIPSKNTYKCILN